MTHATAQESSTQLIIAQLEGLYEAWDDDCSAGWEHRYLTLLADRARKGDHLARVTVQKHQHPLDPYL